MSPCRAPSTRRCWGSAPPRRPCAGPRCGRSRPARRSAIPPYAGARASRAVARAQALPTACPQLRPGGTADGSAGHLDQLEEVAVGIAEACEAALVGVLDLAHQLHAAADDLAHEAVEVVDLDAHQHTRLLEEPAAALAWLGPALDAQLEPVAPGPEAVVVVLEGHRERRAVELL